MYNRLQDLKDLSIDEMVERLTNIAPSTIMGNKFIVTESSLEDAYNAMEFLMRELYSILLHFVETDEVEEMKDTMRQITSLQMYFEIAFKVILNS